MGEAVLALGKAFIGLAAPAGMMMTANPPRPAAVPIETAEPQVAMATPTPDLDARVISAFRNGYEIGASAVPLGTRDKPTPLGRREYFKLVILNLFQDPFRLKFGAQNRRKTVPL